MLLGQFTGRVDERCRVPLPKKFRSELRGNIILTKGFDTNLIVVAEERWQILLEGTSGKPFIDRNARETQRFLLGNAIVVSPDEKGRILIPVFLKTYAKLTHEVVFVGIERFVEVWDKTLWEKEQDRLVKTMESVTKRLQQESNE